jgi:hypothetical protein
VTSRRYEIVGLLVVVLAHGLVDRAFVSNVLAS